MSCIYCFAVNDPVAAGANRPLAAYLTAMMMCARYVVQAVNHVGLRDDEEFISTVPQQVLACTTAPAAEVIAQLRDIISSGELSPQLVARFTFRLHFLETLDSLEKTDEKGGLVAIDVQHAQGQSRQALEAWMACQPLVAEAGALDPSVFRTAEIALWMDSQAPPRPTPPATLVETTDYWTQVLQQLNKIPYLVAIRTLPEMMDAVDA